MFRRLGSDRVLWKAAVLGRAVLDQGRWMCLHNVLWSQAPRHLRYGNASELKAY